MLQAVVQPGNRRAVALIHVSTVTQMTRQGIATSPFFDKNVLVFVHSSPGSEKPTVFTIFAVMGTQR